MANQWSSRRKTNANMVLVCGVLSVSSAAVAQTKINMGALLDQATEACEQGDTARLVKLDQHIRGLLKQHPELQAQEKYLTETLALFQTGVCKPQQPLSKANFRVRPPNGLALAATEKKTTVQLSTGYFDNVNQGSRHELISFTSPFNGLQIEGRLDERSLPLSSALVGVRGIYQVIQDGGRKVSTVAVSRQEYPEASDFSNTALSLSRQQVLSAGKEASARLNVIRDDQGNTEQRLGGSYYQPWGATEQRKLGLLSTLEYVNYPKKPEYEAVLAGVAVERLQALPKGDVRIRGGLEFDRALDNRPGGDRRKIELSAQWGGKERWAGWQPIAGAKVTYQLDAEPFDPRLYGDSTRTQRYTGLNVGVTRNLSDKQKLHLGYQYSQIQDREVKIFDQPVGNAVGVTFETSF
ncbi:MAG: hypothetical protein QJT81_05000 [Candidatus Thiothrix putei]|uniref:Uncharacterized protein n=1 Tax=Candidatus Thiothrix putei TaxID=3080811 RepID=A0AA95HDL6_9GAMM|nr:MAG: hypothetical protein QJT81_05000 [Candidatus Thiothrix putei]